MSLRVTLGWIFVITLCVYAWRDWFASVCGLILMMAVMEHPDMPNGMFGIPGCNLWNLLMGGVLLAWFCNGRFESLVPDMPGVSRNGVEAHLSNTPIRPYWDMPFHMNVLLGLYALVVLVATLRLLGNLDLPQLRKYNSSDIFNECIVNTYKWVIPTLLIFWGARTRRRVFMAMASVLLLYLFLALQVAKHVPARCVLESEADTGSALKIIADNIGYSRVNMSMMLAGGCWATLSAIPLAKTKWSKIAVVWAAGMVAYGQALTGGRAGYAAWVGVGVFMCIVKWRKFLLLLPVAVCVVWFAMPGVVNRIMEGKGTIKIEGRAVDDKEAMLAGRDAWWPYVREGIAERPDLGWGRMGVVASGTVERFILETGDTTFAQPHSLYLETLIDHGWVGAVPLFLFYFVVVAHAIQLFLFPEHDLEAVVGGMTLSLVCVLFLAGYSSQTFYPREGAMGMWVTIGLLLRLWTDRHKLTQVAKMFDIQ